MIKWHSIPAVKVKLLITVYNYNKIQNVVQKLYVTHVGLS